MKALTAAAYGPVEDVAITEVPKPTAGEGQVLVRVQAAGLNPLDYKLVTGIFKDFMPVEHPFIPGVDAAGVVEAVGEGVTRFAVGDEIVALTFPVGAIAEYTVVNDGPNITHRPAGLSAERAAALPTPILTAAGVAATLDLQAGQNVLLIGGDGAVSNFFLQLVAEAGARVIATSAPANADAVRALGAKEVIDWTSSDVVAETLALVEGGVDVAIDLISAGPGLAVTAGAVKPGGKVLSTLGGPPAFDRDVTAVYVGVEEGFGQLPALIEQAEKGTLDFKVTAFPLAEAPKVFADFAGGRTTGRIVVTI